MRLNFCRDGEDITLNVARYRDEDAIASVKVSAEIGELIATESGAEAVILETFRATYEGRDPAYARGRLSDSDFWLSKLQFLLGRIEEAAEAAAARAAEAEEDD